MDETQTAWATLRKRPYAEFDEQRPHLQTVLKNLPVLSPDAPALTERDLATADRHTLAELLERIAPVWVCQHPPDSHDGAIHVAVAEEPTLLALHFYIFMWGITSNIGSITIARLDEDTYAYWSDGQIGDNDRAIVKYHDVVRQRQPPIRIQALTADTLGDVDQCDNSFTIQNRLSLFMQDEQLHYKVTPLAPPREKHTPPEVEDYTPYLTDPDKAIFLAYVDNQVVGQIVLRKYWNGYAYIQDLAVETQFRRQGIGRALIDQAVNWARAQSLPGLMLETQDINVPACRFYARYGFTLCGFNTHLYRGLPTPLDEVALYWYLLF